MNLILASIQQLETLRIWSNQTQRMNKSKLKPQLIPQSSI